VDPLRPSFTIVYYKFNGIIAYGTSGNGVIYDLENDRIQTTKDIAL
jgi:hypothetical protein